MRAALKKEQEAEKKKKAPAPLRVFCSSSRCCFLCLLRHCRGSGVSGLGVTAFSLCLLLLLLLPCRGQWRHEAEPAAGAEAAGAEVAGAGA